MAGYIDYIVQAANQYGIDPNVALAIAARETGGDDINAINMAGNGGLMQITDYSADDYGVSRMYPNWATDPMQNALGGMYILKRKIAEQGGDLWAGVRAYNGAGPAADQYLSQVQQNYNSLGGSPYQKGFNFQAKDTANKPFINLMAYARTNDPNEPFNYGAIADILSKSDPNVQASIDQSKLEGHDYINNTNFMAPDVARLVKPVSERLMQNRLEEIKDNVGQQILQNNLRKGSAAINLINQSNNVDNKGLYASIMKSVGINVPANRDQYIGGRDLLGGAISDINNQKNYNLAVQESQYKQKRFEAELGLLQDKLNLMKELSGGEQK